MDTILRQADFLVLPSDPGVETLSMAVLEAMAMGLPVVATDVGSMREVVTTDVGMLVNPGDLEGLAQALTRMAEDRDLREKLGLSARKFQRDRFSSDRMREEMLDYFRELADRR